MDNESDSSISSDSSNDEIPVLIKKTRQEKIKDEICIHKDTVEKLINCKQSASQKILIDKLEKSQLLIIVKALRSAGQARVNHKTKNSRKELKFLNSHWQTLQLKGLNIQYSKAQLKENLLKISEILNGKLLRKALKSVL